jgi:thiamine pyrophosphokinase
MTGVIICGGRIEDYNRAGKYCRGADIVISADSGARHCKALGIVPDIVLGDFDSIDRGDFRELEAAGAEILRYPVEKDMTDSELAVETAIKSGCSRVILLGSFGSRLDHSISNLFLLKKLHDANVEGIIADEKNEIRLISGSIKLNSISISLNSGSIGLNNDSISLDNGNISQNNGSISQNNGSISQNNGSISPNKDSISPNKDSISLNKDSISLNNGSTGLYNGSIRLKREDGVFVSLVPFGGDASGVSTRGLYYPLDGAVLRMGSSRGISNVFVDDEAYVEVKDGLLLVILSRE